VFDPPIPAELTDIDGRAVTISGRGEQRHAPACVRSRVVEGVVRGWAGPWAHDVRWWDPHAHRRCVHYQLLVDDPKGRQVACLAVVENGEAAIEALYD
jgi:hypothetical protein